MPAADHLHASQTVFLFLLLTVAVFAAVAQRLKVSVSIMLVLAGLGISFLPRAPRIPLSPELIFVIFLPPLLYAAAWQTNWREFKRNLVSISMLAVGLVGFTVCGIAFLADHFITALDFKSGFILGAVLATTDAVAATSIARSVSLPQRIVDLLEGESLLNDATGLLALEFGLAMLLRDQTPTVGGAALRLVWLIGGGLGIGLLIAKVNALVERYVDHGPIEMVISIVVPYAAYLTAEDLRASGVLAVVACGLYMSRKSVQLFSPPVRIQIFATWGALDFMLNGIVFVLIGLQLPYVIAGIREYSWLTLLEYGATLSGALIVLRLVWMYPGALLAWWIRSRWLKQTGRRPKSKEIFVVGWTGMRGVVALAAAISIPETLASGQPFAQRNLIIFLTFSVILVTLVLQGLTLPPLIRLLGLAGGKGVDEEELFARRAVLEVAVEHLRNGALEASESELAHGYQDLLHTYEHRLAAVCNDCYGNEDEKHSAVERYKQVNAIALQTVQLERLTLITLRDEGRIGDDVLRRLERELDLIETRYAHE